MADQSLRRTPLPLQCRHCGSAFERTGRAKREYCSDECKAAAKRILRKLRPNPVCERCKRRFERSGNRQKFCIDCRKSARREYSRAYHWENAKECRATMRDRAAQKRREDPDGARARDRAYRVANWPAILERARSPKALEQSRIRQRRYLQSPKYRLNNRIHAAIGAALRDQKAGRRWEVIVGYTLNDLIVHLERQFVKGMGWHNFGDWEIDHIVPRSSFTFTGPDDPEFQACWALTNLRPMWSGDNRSKGGYRIHLL